MNQTC